MITHEELVLKMRRTHPPTPEQAAAYVADRVLRSPSGFRWVLLEMANDPHTCELLASAYRNGRRRQFEELAEAAATRLAEPPEAPE